MDVLFLYLCWICLHSDLHSIPEISLGSNITLIGWLGINSYPAQITFPFLALPENGSIEHLALAVHIPYRSSIHKISSPATTPPDTIPFMLLRSFFGSICECYYNFVSSKLTIETYKSNHRAVRKLIRSCTPYLTSFGFCSNLVGLYLKYHAGY